MKRIKCSFAVGMATVLSSTSALAGSAKRCAQTYEQAQREKIDGHYVSAMDHAVDCAQPQCPEAITNECTKLYEALKSEVPTFVFSARKPDGSDLTQVRVLLDGAPLLEALDGKPIRLDPGAHQFRFETEGYPPVEATYTARVGESHRLIEIPFSDEQGKTGQPEPQAGGAGPRRGIPAASYVLAGAGVVALGAFTYLRLSGINDYDELDSSCSPHCDPKAAEAVREKFQLSYVALGVGIASLGAATAIFVLSRDDSGAPRTEVSLAPNPSAPRAALRTHF